MTLFSISLAAQESRKTIRSFDASWKLIFQEALKKHTPSWKLVKAIRAHDNKKLSEILKNPTINVNPIVMKGSEGFKTQLHPLDEAISCNNIEAVKLLLAHTVTLGTTKINTDGSMAGHYFDIKDIDINAPGLCGLTPLHTAVSLGRTECLKLLLAHKRTIWYEKLLPFDRKEAAINLNAAEKYGNTALHLAVSLDKADLVELLLAHPGIDVNAKNNEGWTPLHTAVWYETTDCIKLLLAHKEIKPIDPNLINWIKQELDTRKEQAERAFEIWLLLENHGQILDGPGGMSPTTIGAEF